MTVRRAPVRIMRKAFVAMWNDPAATTDQIAAAFGVFRSSVTPLGYRMGLPPRKTGAKPSICRETFTALWLAKVSTREIAKGMGISHNYCGVLARRIGLERRPQGMRGTITFSAFCDEQLRLAMAASARETRAALWDSEMVDGDPRRRAA